MNRVRFTFGLRESVLLSVLAIAISVVVAVTNS
jgi:hypothetical protein